MSPPDLADRADLHSHTIYSDGILSPEELVTAAVEAGLGALAVTDHDTIVGVPEALDAAHDLDLEIVPGIEFSTRGDGGDLHLLGLLVDPYHPAMTEATERYEEIRRSRARRIVQRLDELGVPVEMDAVDRIAGPGSIGRPHLAEALVEAGHVADQDDAFRRYLGIDRPGYVAKDSPSVEEMIDTVHEAGGAAVVAHPASSRIGKATIRRLADLGLDGIEARHPKHSGRQARRLQALADELSLFWTAGSDFHGPGRGRSRLGRFTVSMEELRRLERSLGARPSNG